MDIHQARQLAEDESTAPEKLRELANLTDLIVRKHIVINSNIPPDVLIRLAAEFPKQVFDNPAIDLLLLETPNLFFGTSANALCGLLKREVPMRMIEYATNSTDERLKLAILMNPCTSQETLKELAKNINYQLQEATELHINFTSNNAANCYKEFVEAKIQQKIADSDKKYQEILGDVDNLIKLYDHAPRCISGYMRWSIPRKKSNFKITLSEVEKMINSKKSIINIASNHNISVEIINKLLERPDPFGDIGRRIGINPSTPIEILEELAKSNRHAGVYESVARNPKTTTDILEILLDKNSMNGYVYPEIARHPKINEKIIAKILNKSNDSYGGVFNNPNTPIEIRKKLLEYFSNKQTVAINKYCPQEFINNTYIPGELLEKCISKTIEQIKNIENPTYTRSKEFKKLDLNRLETIAFHPNITSNGLKTLLNYEDRFVRSSAIANYKTPQYITEVWGMSFLKTLNQKELKSLASNFYATEELLKELVNHQDITVSRTAASNPCASDEILEEWETSPFYKEGVLEQIMAEEQRLLDRWESSISASNRLTVLLNFETPVSVLAKISRSSSWLERYAIAQNPNTPYPIIQRLAEDGNRIVRAAAKAKL